MLPEIDARFGRHPVGECDAVTSAPESKKDLRRRLLAGVHAHGDLTVHWEQSFPWSALYSPRFGTVELRNQDARTGSHATHAFMLASGEGIPKGATISGASIFDLVPTILYGAGMRADHLRRPTPVSRIVHPRMIASASP